MGKAVAGETRISSQIKALEAYSYKHGSLIRTELVLCLQDHWLYKEKELLSMKQVCIFITQRWENCGHAIWLLWVMHIWVDNFFLFGCLFTLILYFFFFFLSCFAMISAFLFSLFSFSLTLHLEVFRATEPLHWNDFWEQRWCIQACRLPSEHTAPVQRDRSRIQGSWGSWQRGPGTLRAVCHSFWNLTHICKWVQESLSLCS